MKKKYIIIVITAVILIGTTLGFIWLKNSKTGNSVYKPQYYKVSNVEKVFINGVITPKEEEKIYLDASKGTLNETYVEDGQIVNEGDKLFLYNNQSIEAQIEQLNYQIKSSEASKAALNDKLYSANLNLDEKQQQLNNISNATNTEDAIEASTNLNNRATLEATIAQIKSEISVYEDQISSNTLTLNSLYEQKTNLEEKQYIAVVAPISGKVIISADSNSMTLPYITIESKNLIIEGTISERDFTKVKVDDEISVLVIPTNKTVEGKLAFISDRPLENTIMQSTQSSSSNSNLSYYEVKIELNAQDDLVNGFHSQGKITLGDVTIKIPQTAIIEEEGKQYVFVKVDNLLKKREVTVGETIGEEVVIKSGVEENDEVMENPTANTKEGIAVE